MKWIFQSERLLYRQFTMEDGELIIQLNSDPEVLRYIHEPPTTSSNVMQVLQHIILPQYKLGLGRWAVHLKHDETFIGWAGLKNIPAKEEIDLGYRFMKPFWGSGYATEAASTCLSVGFAHLGLERIVAKAHAENIGSLRVIQKCGMTFVREDVEDGLPIKVYEMVNRVVHSS